MNMAYVYSSFIILIILPAVAMKSIQPRSGQIVQGNGCGSTFSIDWALKAVGEGIIIPCCNAHDTCYETCGRTQSECDNAFESCLDQACSQLNGNGFDWWNSVRRVACKQDGQLLFTIVDAFGSSAYENAQENCF